MISIIVFILLFICPIFSVIPVSNYIWLNYGQVNLLPNDDNSMIMRLPCQTRIGTCKIQYTLIPWGWTALPNGDLLIPKSDTIIDKSFPIEAIMTQPTQQVLVVSLIADYEGGVMNIMDSSTFYTSISYPSAPKPQNSSKASKKNQPLPTPTETPPEAESPPNVSQNLPPITQVRALLNSGNLLKIVTKISQIISIKADCQTKIKYLNEVKALLQDLLAKNQGDLEVVQNQISELQVQISKLRDQQKKLVDSLNSEASEKIKILQAKKKQAEMTQIKNEQIAYNYLSAIRKRATQNQPIQNSTEPKNQQFSSQAQERQLTVVNNALQRLILRKNQLQKSIMMKKMQKTIQQLKSEVDDLKTLEDKYREYSQLAVVAKIQAENINYELVNYQEKVQQYNDSLEMLQNLIKSKQAERDQLTKVDDGRQVSVVKAQIQSLSGSQTSIQNAIYALNRCL